jgi:hypothetical protein
MKKIILLLLLIGSFSTLLFAQSSFLEKGQSGLLLSALSSANQDLSGYSGEIGYSFSGVLDLGLSIGQYGYYEPYVSDDLKATILSPFISYLIFKQDESTPLSISLNSSYQKQFITNGYLDNFYTNVTGDHFRIGTSVFTDIEFFNAIKVQPKAGFGYRAGKIKFEDSSGGSATTIHDTVIFDLGASFMLSRVSNYSFVVTPGIGIQKDLTNLNLSVSLLLPNN